METVPPLLAIGLLANLISITVSVAGIMIVLYQSRRRENVLMSLFFIAVAVASLSLIVFRLSPFMPFNITPWMYLQVSAISAYGILIFVFATTFTNRVTPLVRAGYALGALLFVIALGMTWTGNLITAWGIDARGVTSAEYSTVGFALIVALLSFEVWALVALLIHPDERSKALVPGVALLILSAISNAVPALVALPIASLLVAVAVVSFGQVIMRFQLMNPLAEVNRELAQAIRSAEEANAAKSRFLASMSHELRTPLNSVIGYSQMMLSGAYGPLNGKQKDRLGTIHRNGENLLALINDILDLSKIEAGGIELDLEPLDIHDVVDEVVSTVTPLAEEKGLKLKVQVPGHVAPLTADANRLRQMMLNLMSNAIKFTDTGSVTLKVEEDRPRQRLFIRVIDTGVGIPADQMERVFEEFHQVQGGLSADSKGTGLGLPISRKLARMHGGDITATSEVGTGTTFTIMLPTEAAEAPPVAA